MSETRADQSERARPGTLLATLIQQVTGETTRSGCNCYYRRRRMDAWGWAGCWKQRHTILRWLVEEAEKRGHAIETDAVLPLLRAAIIEAHRSTPSDQTEE